MSVEEGAAKMRPHLPAFNRLLITIVTWTLITVSINGQVLTPPYFNLAVGRRITASSTCGVGVSGSELYCKLVGANTDKQDNPNINLIQGQVCDYCNPSSGDPETAHPPEYAIDGTERWWQSPPLSRGMQYNRVNLTVDLGQEYHVAYVFIKMANSPRPGIWALERSIDNGKTYKPWQYFADTESDCIHTFGKDSVQTITQDDTVVCETKFSKVVPLEGGEIVVSLLNDRPNANNFSHSNVLQEWTKATNIRLNFIRTKTLLGHLMSVARQDSTVTRRYFYSVKDISIGGRCVCNGHAGTCDITDPQDPYKLLCRCQHNTCGPQCGNCCPGFVQKKWRRATLISRHDCEPCNCFGHSTECIYDEAVDEEKLSIDIHGKNDGGGVCKNCQHNTIGINCNECKAGYFRGRGKLLNATDVCEECDCNFSYSTGSCEPETGKCECSPAFLAPDCDECSIGYHGFPDCRPCDCNANGTLGEVCEVQGGQCPCRPNFEGQNCNRCKSGYYEFPDCNPCECDTVGSMDEVCDMESGKCKCITNYGGRNCGQCAVGWYNYPTCEFCNCDTLGSTEEMCNNQTGECLCKKGYGGERCDQCAPMYHGYPNCVDCECNMKGSNSLICSASGQCQCLKNFSGRTCNQCSPGYYNYPDCLACNCDFTGAIGISCNEEGTCTCKNNFDNKTCNVCKEGFYNYPLCEECNCNPSGVLASFGGCGSLADGLLCECKERVSGRICNTCKPLYWNLRANNLLGCEDCKCHPPGTIGGSRFCDSDSGQCMCKPNVQSRRCDKCKDGSYQLEESNLFGCIDCGCNVGGSVNMKCAKTTGKCMCRPRINGRTCSQPLKVHYFPTLYQHQYELEEGKTSDGTAVRYSYNQEIFPNYSWKGYAVFSQLQNEVLIEVEINKPSLYHIILHYMNINEKNSEGEVRLIPETPGEVSQANSIIFTSTTEGTLLRVNSPSGVPVPFVLNPGRWTISVSADDVLIDYIVLLPSAFYEATILQESIDNPCTIATNSKGSCRRYKYPEIRGYITVRADTGYIGSNETQADVVIYDDKEIVNSLNSGTMVLLNKNQTNFQVDMNLDKPGRYIFVVIYHTVSDRKDISSSATIEIEMATDSALNHGRATLYNCPYSILCRQAINDNEGRIAMIDIKSNFISFKINLNESKEALIHSIVAIHVDDWSQEYLVPKSSCIQVEGQCRNYTGYDVVPNSVKVEFETSEHNKAAKVLPDEIYSSKVKLILLVGNETMVDIAGTTPIEGEFVFIVHYYQPNLPTYDVDVLIQNGQFYEATLKAEFCPSNTGCRSILRKKIDGSDRFNILKNFILTLNNNAKKSLWVDYILAVPATEYTVNMLQEKFEDRAGKFLAECSQDNFRLSLEASEFCKESIFSLTSEYNNGALQCTCSTDGSLSFECDNFGGQCQCRPHVIGRTCSECETGYHGFPNCQKCNCPSTAICHHITGQCICPARVIGDQCDTCAPLTFGFDSIIGCQECNCNPLGVENGELQCNRNTGICPCKPNVVRRKCDQCAAGYWAFPYCQLCECDLRGTTDDICNQDNSQCHCKENVYSAACDKCKPSTFYLEERNPAGCTKCFCFGATDRCRSAIMYKIQTLEYEGWQGKAINLDTASLKMDNGINTTIEIVNGTITTVLPTQMPDGTFFYFSAPEPYLGNKITSYGGLLRYTASYEIDESLPGGSIIGPDVILVGNNMTIMHEHLEQPSGLDPFSAEVPILESEFIHLNGKPVSREQFMVLLVGLESIYIRGLYYQPTEKVSLSEMMLDIAVKGPVADAPQALEVESCQCPPNYRGTSCEECAPGYYRSSQGPHLGYCVPCQCHGHAHTCDVNTGKCFDCQHDTMGDHCEQCLGGYYGDATVGTIYDCMICVCPLPYPSNNFATSCEVSPSGTSISCDCKEGYYGPSCDVCSAGYYGRPDIIGGHCQTCKCSGNINSTNPGSCDSLTGDCLQCLYNTAGTACNYCEPGYYGDAIIDKDCKRCSCDECGTEECENQVGVCECRPNVIGENCNQCAPEHWGFKTCLGCRPCKCGEASDDKHCDIESGQCKCKPGVTGLMCDICEPGYWNYTFEGCQHCNCDEIYSAGAACDPNTGQCQCLPGVIGDKCDHCPWRWVLITDQGCQQCGPCVHSLLDDTDNITNILDPALAELEGASSSFFAYKRLHNVNSTLFELRPLVDKLLADPYKLDLGPLKDNLKTLEVEAQDFEDRKTQTENKVVDLNKKAHEVNLEALVVEEEILDNIKQSYSIVKIIEDLAIGLEAEEATSDLDKFIQEAERMLTEIESKNLTMSYKKAENENNVAYILLGNIQKFVLPSITNKGFAKELTIKVERLNNLLKELMNETKMVVSQTNEINSIVEMSRKSSVLTASDKIIELFKNTEEAVVTGDEHIQKAGDLLAEANQAYSMMNDSSLQLGNGAFKLQTYIFDTKMHINGTDELVEQAMAHSLSLGKEISKLNRQLNETEEAAEVAVKAATAYNNIIAAIKDASIATDSAAVASNEAQDLSREPTEVTSKSLKVSKVLMGQSEIANSKVAGALTLENAKSHADVVGVQITESSNGITKVKTELKELGNIQIATADSVISKATGADVVASAAMSKVENNLKKLPQAMAEAEQLIANITEANEGVKGYITIVDRMLGSLPEAKESVQKSKKSMEKIKVFNTGIGNKLAELRRKVALARDQAKRIEVGAKLQGNTSIQLRNPENIQEAATYTQMSFYFRTRQQDGLIAYVGNEVGTHHKLKRALHDDFMAVEVSGGKTYLTIDLGSGTVKLNNDRHVSDNQWHKLEVERTGNTATLTIKTEDEPDVVADIVLRGTKIVLNLHKKESKFYIGGFPSNAKIQESVQTRFFEGDIQGLQFGKKAVSFWNFVYSSGFNDGSRERDKLAEIQTSTGMKFSGTGYVIMNVEAEQLKRQSNIILDFKTYAKNGLIFLATNSKDNFLSIELIDGLVLMKFNLGDRLATLTSPSKLNNGEWHTIEIGRVGQQAILKVNRNSVDERMGTGSNLELNVYDKVYIAGYPGEHGLSDLVEESFEGCIDNFYVGPELKDLNQNIESFGAIAGCPASVARTVSFMQDFTGYVAMPNINIQNFLQLSFKFKTMQPTGLLFFTSNFDQSSSFSVSLVDGSLVVRSRPGGDIQTTVDTRYNDSNWHYVMVSKNDRKLRIDIDDFTYVEQELYDDPIVVTTTPLYFGGVPDDIGISKSSSPAINPYIGCLGDTTVNGKFQNFAKSLDRPGASLASCQVGGSAQTTPRPKYTKPTVPTTSTTVTVTEEVTTIPTTTELVTEPDTRVGECSLPLIPLTDRDLMPDSGFRFGNKPDSRLEYNDLNQVVRDRSELSLQFKTTAESGLLFYAEGVNHTDFISVFMNLGKVHYYFNCGTGKAEIVSNMTYNDGDWHTVAFLRKAKSGKLIVDDNDVTEGTSVGRAAWVNIKAPFYFGGLPDDITSKTSSNIDGIRHSFNGCLRDLRQSNVNIKASNLVSVSQCSEKVEPGSFFSSTGGYIQIKEKFTVGLDMEISMDIKPRNLTGVILANHRPNGDYLAMQLIDGNLEFLVNNGAGPISVTYYPSPDHYLCDGQWHHLYAVKTKNVITMSIDGMFVPPGIGKAGISSTDTNDPLYLGGIPEGELPKGIKTTTQFTGCIANIKFNNDKQNLLEARVFGDVTMSTCPTI